ncbi:MAG: serine dehydratase, partial [Clostridia bacterium]|nr:serine dehydratase [Clostridia bacterium]
MKSIRDIYKIGRGPSSSHTMGPQAAVMRFAKEYPKAAKYKVILYGSLAKTGKGHMTDTAILEILPATTTEIFFCKAVFFINIFCGFYFFAVKGNIAAA